MRERRWAGKFGRCFKLDTASPASTPRLLRSSRKTACGRQPASSPRRVCTKTNGEWLDGEVEDTLRRSHTHSVRKKPEITNDPD